ncbi:type II secretion system F family protein [bacterium]|nr:type II secretion system F family protein [bacterium]NDD84807.1 type II secretion system F family protein [bacterium]NDG32899.1 type II secretion system F family protein [bacterium]
MLTYTYTARDTATGQKVKAEVQAESEQAAARLIQKEGLAPLEIKAKDIEGTGFKRFFNKVKTKDRVIFARQLSTLINAGLPLVQSLRSVLAQTKSKPLQSVINSIITDVESGKPMSEAITKFPKVFNQVFVSLIASGETSGTLDTALERIANQQEKDAEIMAKVKGAMTYPAIVMLVMAGVVGFMITSVLPQVETLYDGISGVQLPLITRVLLVISHFIIDYWYIVIVLLIVLGFITSKWARTLGGKSVVDALKMRMWPIGPLFMKLYMARFARTATTLVSTGVPLIQTLEITAKAVDNIHISKSIRKAIEKVKGGKALSASLTGDDNFLELVPQMLKIGEDSGAIEQMLEKTADYYEKEVDNQIKSISTIIEPVLMIVLGVVALIIVGAVLLPIYGLVGKSVIK